MSSDVQTAVPARICVSAVTAGPVLARVFGILGARAGLSLDRVSDLLLAADTIADADVYADGLARVEFVVSDGPGRAARRPARRGRSRAPGRVAAGRRRRRAAAAGRSGRGRRHPTPRVAYASRSPESGARLGRELDARCARDAVGRVAELHPQQRLAPQPGVHGVGVGLDQVAMPALGAAAAGRARGRRPGDLGRLHEVARAGGAADQRQLAGDER